MAHNKKSLSERDICTQYISPALVQAGRDFATQVREEVTLSKGRVIVRGKMHSGGKQKRADYVLYSRTEQQNIVTKLGELALCDCHKVDLAESSSR